MSRKWLPRSKRYPVLPALPPAPLDAPRYEDVTCFRALHPCDGKPYCVGHGYAWPCTPPDEQKPGAPMT
jgi:hypothetical protein